MANGADGLRPPSAAATIDSNATDTNANGSPDTLTLADPAAALVSLEFGEPGFLVPADGSPLIDPRVLASVDEDFVGIARDAAPDIGAYEWTGVLPPTLSEDDFKSSPGDGDGDGDGDTSSDDSEDGDDTSSGSETGAETGTGESMGESGPGEGDDEVGETAADVGLDAGADGDAGCACTTGDRSSPLGWLLLSLASLAALRRRQCGPSRS